jgi:hypothetical protein
MLIWNRASIRWQQLKVKRNHATVTVHFCMSLASLCAIPIVSGDAAPAIILKHG